MDSSQRRVKGNEITVKLAKKGTKVGVEEKPLEVNSVTKLVLHQIHEICRKESAKLPKGKKMGKYLRTIKKSIREK